MLGKAPTAPKTCPTKRSALQSVGSIFVPTPIRPPGTANCSSFCSVYNDTIREKIGRQVTLPSASLLTTPGLTSISCPTFKTPLKILPPATPPFKSLTSQPGLLTSKDRMTIKRGSDVKSRTGTGIFLVMYSQSTYKSQLKKNLKTSHKLDFLFKFTSILYFN